MQFKNLFLAAVAAAFANAVELTNSNFDVTAGTPFTITWADASGPVTLTLKDGPSTDLVTVSTIGDGLTGTSYTWTPPATLTSSLYAIEISDSTGTPNYSVQFQVSGATATAAASTVTASSTSVSSASASSSSASVSESSTITSSSSASSSSSSSALSNSTSTITSSNSSATSKSSSLTTSASKTSSGSTTSKTTAPATSAPTSAAAELASPLAFIFLAFAAIVTLN